MTQLLTRIVIGAAVFFVVTLLYGCGERVADRSSPPPGPNGDSRFKFVRGTKYYDLPDIAMPSKGKSIKGPNFHTKITRITDRKLDGYIGPGIQNEYAKADPENSNGTLLVLRGNTAAWYLYDLSTLKPILKDFIKTGGQEPEPRWDASNPKIFYYVWNTELRSYNIKTRASTTIHDFKDDFPAAAYITTKVEGDASLDRRYWAFMVEDSDWKFLSVIVYDKKLDKIIGRKGKDFPDVINWVGMDMSGEHVLIGHEELTYAEVFSRDFSRRITLPDGSNGHGDLALTADGRDVQVYQNVRTDYIAMTDLNTGTETPLVKIPFNINTDIGLHFSGNSSKTPGWILVSTYGAKNPSPGKKHSWMDAQLFMVELKANPRIWRIAHTNSYTSLDATGEKNYFAEAFATINKKGSRIYFGSNWGKFTPDYTETYQVILPNNWPRTMPRK